MKAKLIFDLSDPDDRIEHQHAMNGSRLACAIHDYDQWLRAVAKYEGKEKIDIGEARSKLRDFIEGQGLVFDNIIY